MDYCIGYFTQANGNYDLMLCKNGNGYYLGLKNTETKEYKTRDFDSLDEAIKIFNKMVEILIKHIGNDTYKKNVFYSSVALQEEKLMKTLYSLTYFINGFEYEEEYSTKELAIENAKDLKNAEDILIRKITTNYVGYEEIEFIDF